MILHSLLKTGQYFSKDSLEYNTDEVKGYDKCKAEQLYKEWLKKKEGTEVKGRLETQDRKDDEDGTKLNDETEVKGGIETQDRKEDKEGTELNDETEVKQEPENFPSDLETDQYQSNSIALKRDMDINERIDLHIALFESNEILRENLGVEESISILNNYFASKNVTSVDKSEQVKEATKDILEKYNAVSTDRPHILPPEPSDNAYGVGIGSMNRGSNSVHQSKQLLLGSSDAIPVDSAEERLSLQNAIPDKNIQTYSKNQEVYTPRDITYTTDKRTVCTCKNAINCAIKHFSASQSHLQETNREHEERPYKYRKMDSTTSSQNQNYNSVGYSQGAIELPHQQQYELYLASDTEQNSDNTQTCDSNGKSYQLPRNQSVISNTNIPEPYTHLPEPAILDKLPKLIPLEEYEVNDDEVEEEEAEEVVRRSSYNYIPDIKALAEDAVMRMPGNSKRRNRKYRYIKNWEFLMRLLADPRSNPWLIRWENEDQYTFRLVQEDIITDIWNSKSERAPVTYNNFARGIRYHYTTGVIIPVRERQMVYGCGPDAVEFLHELLRNQKDTNESNSSFFRPWN